MVTRCRASLLRRGTAVQGSVSLSDDSSAGGPGSSSHTQLQNWQLHTQKCFFAEHEHASSRLSNKPHLNAHPPTHYRHHHRRRTGDTGVHNSPAQIVAWPDLQEEGPSRHPGSEVRLTFARATTVSSLAAKGVWMGGWVEKPEFISLLFVPTLFAVAQSHGNLISDPFPPGSSHRKFAEKAMFTKDVRIDTKLNKALWATGVRNVPKRIRVRLQPCSRQHARRQQRRKYTRQ